MNRTFKIVFINSIVINCSFANPNIEQTIPGNNEINVNVNSGITIQFTESMISSTLNNSTIIIIGSRSGSHNNLEISYDTANYSAIVLSDKQYY
ncbi:MAG: Ig-like domain-containing protein, partial [Candidatus Marinimicrobia bacterium]|nr:Ig-like domain-containing protein [Candidatus Neomarinimicrobiota bacterium]